MADLLVVGLDLETGREVDIADREVPDWYPKGHNGDQTLVCKHCYEGVDLPGGPRVVALVPKGRLGGRRRKHFAHPPGMTPPRGQHSLESLWHATAKQRLRRWAENQGAQARVEAYTPDGRRRSDVAITLPGGGQVAIEVQLGEISDTEWLARHRDYARTGTADVWLWHETTWVPRVMFACHQPGWLLDLDTDQIGLIHAQPVHAAGNPLAGTRGCGEVHWPPCPEDRLGVRWMPVASTQLTRGEIKPSPQAAAYFTKRTATPRKCTAAPAIKQAARPLGHTSRAKKAIVPQPITRQIPAAQPQPSQVRQAHAAFRYDAFPPWADPDTLWFYCDTCGRSFTGAEIKASAIIHTVPSAGSLTSTGQLLINYTQYGVAAAQATDQNPAAQDP